MGPYFAPENIFSQKRVKKRIFPSIFCWCTGATYERDLKKVVFLHEFCENKKEDIACENEFFMFF